MGIESRVKKSLLPIMWRNSFEVYSVYAALGGFGYYYYLYTKGMLPDGGEFVAMFWLIPALLGYMLVLRFFQATKMWFRRIRLYGKTLDFWSERKKRKRFNQRKGFMSLGDGFEWKNEHSQAAYEAIKLDMDKVRPPLIAFWLYQLVKWEKIRYLKRPEDREKGKGWIHGLSDKLTPLLVAVSDLVDGFIVLGTTGAGKTRFLELIVSQDIHRKDKETVIMVDPKIDKDLYPRMMYECKQAGREDDFVMFSLAHPTFSVGMNPLHNYLAPSDVAARMIGPFFPEPDAFVDSLEQRIIWTVQGFELVGIKPSINNILRVVETSPDELVKDAILFYAKENNIGSWSLAYDQYIKQIAADTQGIYARPDPMTPDETVAAVMLYEQVIKKSSPDPTIDDLIVYYNEERKHTGKMIKGAISKYAPLRSGEIGKIINPDLDDNPNRPWWDMSSIVLANKVLYVGSNAMGNPRLSDAVSAMFVADLNEVSASRYNYDFTGDHPINLRVDESASQVTDYFISLLNKGRGSGIRVIMCAQTLPDFVVRLGTEAAKDQVIGNANQVVSLRVKDTSTKEYVSAEMGDAIITTTQSSQGFSPMSSNSTDVTSFGTSFSERTTEAKDVAISPELFGTLPNLEYFASLSGGRVIKGKIPILKKPAANEWPTLNDVPWVKRQKKLEAA